MNNKKILVMDDDACCLTVVGRMLKYLDFDFVASTTGERTVELYSLALIGGEPFDAVILDLEVLNGMGGVETARRLRELDPGAKLVLSSARSEDMTFAQVQACGFDANLPKPFGFVELTRTLQKLLGNGVFCV
ncbi:MAG: response regulator [Elusimicrobia bacterium]|nr:response regulator [Elusimicrobiota bacterium]